MNEEDCLYCKNFRIRIVHYRHQGAEFTAELTIFKKAFIEFWCFLKSE